MYKSIFLIIVLAALVSCRKIGNSPCDAGPILVFKFKNPNYANFARLYIDSVTGNVLIINNNDDRKEINGYWETRSYSNAVTSVLYADIIQTSNGVSKAYRDSLKLKIIDRHPFTELYSVCHCIYDENKNANDSLELSYLIRNNLLKSCGQMPLP